MVVCSNFQQSAFARHKYVINSNYADPLCIHIHINIIYIYHIEFYNMSAHQLPIKKQLPHSIKSKFDCKTHSKLYAHCSYIYFAFLKPV